MAHRVLAAEFSSKSNQKSAMYVRFLDQGKQKVNSTKSNGQNKPVRTKDGQSDRHNLKQSMYQ